MLQANPSIGASTLDTPAPFGGGVLGAAPDHVDPLLWQLASPAEREVLKNAGAAATTAAAAPSANDASWLPKSQPGPRADAPATAAHTAGTDSQAPASTADQALVVKVTDQFRARFSEAAKDPARFNELIRKAFGERYDTAAAEGLRQQALRNDFSWMPKVEVVGQAQLADLSGTQGAGEGRGAYAQGSDTIYLSRELLASDPVAAERVLTEEIGHAIDARINTQDAVGDEGDIFSALLHGDNVTDADLQAMRADNDHGVINVNGQRVEVEYGWLKKAFKKVTGAVKSVGNFVKNTAKAALNVAAGIATFDFNRVKQGLEDGFDAAKQLGKDAINAIKEEWRDLKKNFQKLMQSKLFNAILMVARFIPIPIVQLVVRVIDLVKAAYSVYQGVKNKSWGAVVGGVASLAGGAAGIAGKLGASASTVSTIQSVASTAQKISQAYSAASSKNFGDAALLAAQAFGASKDVVQTLQTVKTVEGVVKAVENKDYGSAVAGVGTLAGGQLGKAVGVDEKTAASVQQATDAARQVQTFVTAVENKDYGKVLGGVGALGAVVADKVFHVEADPDTVANAQQLARGAQQVAAIARAVDNKDYGGALVQAGAVAGGPVGTHLGTGTGTASLLETAGRAGQQVQSFVASVENDDFAGAVRKGAELLGFERQDRLPGDPPKPAAPKGAAQTVALSDVWTRWEAAQTHAQAQR